MRSWRRSVTAAWVSQLLCIVGFSTSIPFLPFYVQELGVTDLSAVEMWAGLLTTSGAVSMAVMSPIWGTLADRYGRKSMVERAAFGGAVVITLMAFVGNVQQLLVLRTVQGMLTGTVAAFITLVAAVSPDEHMTQNLGLLQVAVYSGQSLGPLVGGYVADAFGYRNAFYVTGALLLISGLLVRYLVEDSPVRAQRTVRATGGLVQATRAIVANGPVLAAVAVLFFAYIANTNVQPILPLYVESIGGDPARAATYTGWVIGATAVASSLSAVAMDPVTKKLGFRWTLVLCTIGAGVLYLPQAVAPTLAVLLIARFASGLFIGGTLPTANSIIARLTPKEQRGTTYGVCTSLQSAARAVGPMVGSSMAISIGMRWVFGSTGILYCLIGLGVIVLARGLAGADRPARPVTQPVAAAAPSGLDPTAKGS